MEEKNVLAHKVVTVCMVVCVLSLKDSGKPFTSLDPSQEPIFPPKLKVHISITLTLVGILCNINS